MKNSLVCAALARDAMRKLAFRGHSIVASESGAARGGRVTADGHRAVGDCFAFLEVLAGNWAGAEHATFAKLHEASQPGGAMNRTQDVGIWVLNGALRA